MGGLSHLTQPRIGCVDCCSRESVPSVAKYHANQQFTACSQKPQCYALSSSGLAGNNVPLSAYCGPFVLTLMQPASPRQVAGAASCVQLNACTKLCCLQVSPHQHSFASATLKAGAEAHSSPAKPAAVQRVFPFSYRANGGSTKGPAWCAAVRCSGPAQRLLCS